MKRLVCVLVLLALPACGGGKTGDTDLAEESAFQTPSATPFDADDGRTTADGSDPVSEDEDEGAAGPGASLDEDAEGDAGGKPDHAPTKPNRNGNIDVPNVVGYNLVEAKELLADHGFDNVKAQDISENLRDVEKDSDWKVCRQTPESGEDENPEAEITLGVLKRTEECP